MMNNFNTTEIYEFIGNQSYKNKTSEETLTELEFTICVIALFFIMIFGILFNLSVILVFVRTKRLWTPMNLILMNLSLSDFLVSVLGTPISFVAAIYRGWTFGYTMCQFYAFMMTLSGMTAVGTLIAIAVSRCIIISRTFQVRMNFRTSTVSVMLVWMYAVSMAVPPLIGWNRYIIEKPGIACSVDWQTEAHTAGSKYILYIFILGYFAPIGIIIACYSRVIYILKNIPSMKKKGLVYKKERVVTFMAMAMVVATLFTWTPYAVVSLMVYFGYGYKLSPVGLVIPAITAKSSTIFNPVVYFYFNSQVRGSFLKMIPKCHWKKRRDSDPVDFSLQTKEGVTIAKTISNQNRDIQVESTHNL